jgi:plasmid stability protein
MRTTLQIDDDVLESARVLAATNGSSVGAVISELARRALRPTQPRADLAFPTFDVALDAPPITMADVARALDEA